MAKAEIMLKLAEDLEKQAAGLRILKSIIKPNLKAYQKGLQIAERGLMKSLGKLPEATSNANTASTLFEKTKGIMSQHPYWATGGAFGSGVLGTGLFSCSTRPRGYNNYPVMPYSPMMFPNGNPLVAAYGIPRSYYLR